MERSDQDVVTAEINGLALGKVCLISYNSLLLEWLRADELAVLAEVAYENEDLTVMLFGKTINRRFETFNDLSMDFGPENIMLGANRDQLF